MNCKFDSIQATRYDHIQIVSSGSIMNYIAGMEITREIMLFLCISIKKICWVLCTLSYLLAYGSGMVHILGEICARSNLDISQAARGPSANMDPTFHLSWRGSQ